MTTALNPHVYPGQRVITSAGTATIVAFIAPCGTVYAVGPCDRVPHAVTVRCDAWGGEADMEAGLPEASASSPAEPSPRGPRQRGHAARIYGPFPRLAA